MMKVGKTISISGRVAGLRSAVLEYGGASQHDQMVHSALPQAARPETIPTPQFCPETRWGALSAVTLAEAPGKNATRFRRFATRSGGRRGPEAGRFCHGERFGVAGQPETLAILPQDDLGGVSIRAWGQKASCKACKAPCKRISGRVTRQGMTCGRQDLDQVDRRDRIDWSCGRRTCGRQDRGSGPRAVITIVRMAGSRRDLTQASAIYRRGEVAHG